MFFPSSISKCLCFLLLSAAAFGVVTSENATITIPLNKTLNLFNKELYGDFYTIKSSSTLQINITSVNKKVTFIIFQVHSHLYNFTLYSNVLQKGTFVTGTNVGLYGTVKPPDTYYVMNKNMMDLKLYISVHGYTASDPIAGGCNMEFPVPISPFMKVQYNKYNISAEAPPPQDPVDKVCLGVSSKAVVEFYRMYLMERDFNENSYFDGIKNMLTLDKILQNGIVVPQVIPSQFQRRMLSAYPGTGSIYVAVAYYKNGSINNVNENSYSIYTPSYTYACSPIDGCDVLGDSVSHFFCAVLFFVGLFTCFLGHRFFKTEMFLIGMFAGVIITFVFIQKWTDLDTPELLGASFLSGIFFGAIWVLFWWFYGIPVLSVALITMHLGFILAALIYHTAPDSNMLFRNDGQFWTIFTIFMVCTSITLTTVSYLSNILCCAILGAYAAVFSIDYYIGSNLKYIVINTIRRASLEKFSYAILAPPFQWRDTIVTLMWVALSVSGFLFQHRQNVGRPPFPPPPRSINRAPEPLVYGTINNIGRRFRGLINGRDPLTTARAVDERTPLLDNED